MRDFSYSPLSSSMRYESSLVLTPSCRRVRPSGLALADGTVWGSSSKRPYRAPFGALWAVLGSSAKYLSKSPCKDLSNWYGGSCLAPLHINGGSSCEYPHTGGQVHAPPQAERGRDFTGLVEAVQCSCTSMAQCMRHAPLDIFTPSCLDMHGEYNLTPPHSIIAAKMCALCFMIITCL